MAADEWRSAEWRSDELSDARFDFDPLWHPAAKAAATCTDGRSN
jgi:hypothetical protein